MSSPSLPLFLSLSLWYRYGCTPFCINNRDDDDERSIDAEDYDGGTDDVHDDDDDGAASLFDGRTLPLSCLCVFVCAL